MINSPLTFSLQSTITLIHYELRGPFYDVIVMSSIAQYNCDVTKRATQLIVYQGDYRPDVHLFLSGGVKNVQISNRKLC